jgi:hypothetical protein
MCPTKLAVLHCRLEEFCSKTRGDVCSRMQDRLGCQPCSAAMGPHNPSPLTHASTKTSNQCDFVTAVPITKLFARGERDMEDMCYEIRRAEACVD